MSKTEIEQLCGADDNPELLKEWGAALVRLGVTNATTFLAQHEGLRPDIPTEDGLKAIQVSLRAIIGAYFGDLRQLIDANSDASNDDAVAGTLRAQQRTAMVCLHMLCVQQRPHTVEAQLATIGLGDSEARAASDARRRKENATRLAGQMLDEASALYNKPIDPDLWAEAGLYVTVRDGFKESALRSFPDLDSAKLGKRGYSTKVTQKLARRRSKAGSPHLARRPAALGRTRPH